MEPISTPRLILRPLTPGSLVELHRLVYADEEVAGLFCGRVKTFAEVEPLLLYKVEEIKYRNGFGSYAIERREDHILLGQMLLGPPLVADYIRLDEDPCPQCNTLEVELGYALGRPYWGHGYVTEAGHAMLDVAFGKMKLRRVITGADPARNPRSAAVARRLGARLVPNRHPGWPGMIGIIDNPMASQ